MNNKPRKNLSPELLATLKKACDEARERVSKMSPEERQVLEVEARAKSKAGWEKFLKENP